MGQRYSLATTSPSCVQWEGEEKREGEEKGVGLKVQATIGITGQAEPNQGQGSVPRNRSSAQEMHILRRQGEGGHLSCFCQNLLLLPVVQTALPNLSKVGQCRVTMHKTLYISSTRQVRTRYQALANPA
eukprot:1160071-Pelagomonas_calceolata.AAC.16